MKITEISALVGRTGFLSTEDGGLQVPVLILDAKQAYGNVRVEITPVGGAGKLWVSLGRVSVGGDVRQFPERLETADEVSDRLRRR